MSLPSIKLNPLAKVLIAILVLIAAGVMIVFQLFNSPLYWENPAVNHEHRQIYAFHDEWEISTDFLTVTFDGGKILPGYQWEDMTGLVIEGNGHYEVFFPDYLDGIDETVEHSGQLEAIYFPLTSEDFEQLKGDLILESIGSWNKDKLAPYFEESAELLTELNIFGVSRNIQPHQGANLAYLFTDIGNIEYEEHKQVVFENDENLINATREYAVGGSYPPENLLSETIGIIIPASLVLLLLCYILSADIPTPLVPNQITKIPIKDSFKLGLISVGYIIIKLTAMETGLTEYSTGIFYIIMGTILLLIYRAEDRPWTELGIGIHNLGRSIVIALIISLLATIFGALRVPVGIGEFPNLINILWTFLTLGLFKEIVLRGVFQGTLENHVGGGLSLILTTLFILIVNLIIINITGKVDDPSIYLEHIIIMPVNALILGYTYLRLKNILCPALISTLFMIFAQLIAF